MTSSKPNFEVGRTYSYKEIYKVMKIKNQGGIRYTGQAPDVEDLSVFVTDTEDAIYGDELSGPVVHYRGEGQTGHQRLTAGNLALTQYHLSSKLVKLFRTRGSQSNLYLGEFRIHKIQTSLEEDRNGAERAVFVFELHRA